MNIKLKVSLIVFAFITAFVNIVARGNKTGLIKVAESNYQWTGVAVSKNGRIFVNYPTWRVPSPFKVAEIVAGKEVPYPSAEANKLFVCVQSVVIDRLDRLWVLDPANPRFSGVVENGPKLYQIDIRTNKIVKTYDFGPNAYKSTSYLNDVRVDTEKEVAYITDSTVGGIIVLDLKTGKSWRALDKDCPAVLANLDGINFKSTGKSAGITNSDGIELSQDGKTLYFSSLTGNILYQIPTQSLRDTTLTTAARCDEVTILSDKNVPTDGILLYKNKLYMGNLPDETLWSFDLQTKKGESFGSGITIRWADSFSIGPHGFIYFTTSQINYPQQNRIKYELYKFQPK